MHWELEHQLSGTFYFCPDGTNIPGYWYLHNRHPWVIIIRALQFTKYPYVHRIDTKSGLWAGERFGCGQVCWPSHTAAGALLLLLYLHPEQALESSKMGIWNLKSDATSTCVIQHTVGYHYLLEENEPLISYIQMSEMSNGVIWASGP